VSAYRVTVRQLDRPPFRIYAIGASSGAVGEAISAHYSAGSAAALSIHPLKRICK
jgi:hypothetical protein